ncbi:hypothetical protein DXB03_03640 [Lachnospiraceae bacterium OF11-28]|nr:hypothetical protein DXB03_03640 [Lachnospiraceae bacterium OF11-28]
MYFLLILLVSHFIIESLILQGNSDAQNFSFNISFGNRKFLNCSKIFRAIFLLFQYNKDNG